LAKEGRLLAYRHQGFWQPADTVKERHALEAAYQRGSRPWMLWEQNGDNTAASDLRPVAAVR
jgi:glucose-1-phosphate cytidylyltransferase